MPVVQYGGGAPTNDFWSQFPVHDGGDGATLSRIGGVGNDLPRLNEDGSYHVQPVTPQQGQWQTMGGQQPGPWTPQGDASGGIGLGQYLPKNQPGGVSSGGDVSEQLKSIIGSDFSPENIKRHLSELQALGIEVQNQQRGDVRPRFRLPNGEQWDFGPGGWINSGHGIQPGFGDASQAPSGGMGQPGGGANGGILQSLRDTPGYQFTLGEGLKGVERSAFAKGTGLTGGTLKALMQYGSGLADTTYGNQLDRYYRAAELGQRSIGQGT